MPIKAVLLDLEGTLYTHGAPLPGARQALAELRAAGLRLRFLTNSDSKTRGSIAQNLAAIGLEIPADAIFTPATAALELLRQQPGVRCFGLLSQELRAEFTPFLTEFGPVKYVLVGDVRECLSYAAFDAAFRHLMAGAELLALQRGRNFLRSDGPHLDTGAFVALLEYASAKQARVLGKPAPAFFQMALHDLGCSPDEVAVVGDDITTDVAGAKAIGAFSILVQTGKYDAAALEGATVQPDLIIASIAQLPSALRGLD
jgi:HAD superfamily hydrolase (TIGR01458 family)